MKKILAILLVLAGVWLVAVVLDSKGVIDLERLNGVVPPSGDEPSIQAADQAKTPAQPELPGGEIDVQEGTLSSAESPASEQPASPAPDGVYYLLTYVSVTTDDGLVGLPPGTRVVRREDGRYDAGVHVIDLGASQITNDLRLAAQASSADRAKQAALLDRLRSEVPTATPEHATALPTSTPAPSVSTARSKQPLYVPGVRQQPSGLQGSTSLGAAHTMTADGYQWQKSPDGKQWVPVRRLNGHPMGHPTPNYRPVR